VGIDPVVSARSENPDPRIVAASESSIAQAAELLAQGKLVAIPTETVYGLAANAWDADAVRKIFQAKNRPATNPLIVHVASVERLADAIASPVDPSIAEQMSVVAGFWPGPLTVVCARGPNIPDIVTAGRSTVAVRIPSHPVVRALLSKCPFPVAAPSANPSNYVSATTARHVADGFRPGADGGASVELILDGGPCQFGVESTIISARAKGPVLLRPGGITAEELRRKFAAIGCSLSIGSDDKEEKSAKLAPGMMKLHYSPNTRLVLLHQAHDCPAGMRVGRIAFRAIDDRQASMYATVAVLSETGDLREVAQHLFSALRRFDGLSLDEIHCDVCEPTGLGAAIMDRLTRAASTS
tara:strand:+ start:179878 stop:180942 length:1065 start_codon:yes stop_codon:yes gene_type:complete